jgi:hypothetical protein
MKNNVGLRIACGVLAGLLLSAPGVLAQGRWEFGFHYSRWGLNLVKSLIEDKLNDTVSSNLADKILGDIQADYPWIWKTGYHQNISFDSSGDNYGAEVRYFPAGWYGSFSIGLSVEQSTMKVGFPAVAATMDLIDGDTRATGTFTGNANGEFLIKPLSFHLSFRWEIFPTAGIHPYFTIGVGASTANAIDTSKYAYSYTGTLTTPQGHRREYSGSESKTLKELRDEQEAKGEKFDIPTSFLPILQLSVGLRGRLTENLYALVDAGIWDGFLLRGGLAFRF